VQKASLTLGNYMMMRLVMEIKEWMITWLYIIGGAIIISVMVLAVMLWLYPMAINIGIAIGRNI
jgi:hypothetical protein